MQVGYEKIMILNEYLFQHGWAVMCDQHLDSPAPV